MPMSLNPRVKLVQGLPGTTAALNLGSARGGSSHHSVRCNSKQKQSKSNISYQQQKHLKLPGTFIIPGSFILGKCTFAGLSIY